LERIWKEEKLFVLWQQQLMFQEKQSGEIRENELYVWEKLICGQKSSLEWHFVSSAPNPVYPSEPYHSIV
jgi:hypothetical protein